MPLTSEMIRCMAQEVYGLELSDARATEIAEEATVLVNAAQRAGYEPNFNDELLSARQVLARAAKDVELS